MASTKLFQLKAKAIKPLKIKETHFAFLLYVAFLLNDTNFSRQLEKLIERRESDLIAKKEILHKFINFVCVRVAWVTKGAQFIEWRKHIIPWWHIFGPLLFITCINEVAYFFEVLEYTQMILHSHPLQRTSMLLNSK